MHTFLKTASYILDFRVSLNARISRGNQYPRVSQPLPYTPVFPSPSSTISRSPTPSFLRYMDLPPHSYFLTDAVPSSVPCTVYHPLRRVEQSKAEGSGIERCGCPPLMNVILRRGERNTAACFPLLVPLYPFLPPTYSLRTRLDPSCSPHPTTIFSPLSTSTTSTYQPLLRFSTPAATSLPSRHTTTKHSI